MQHKFLKAAGIKSEKEFYNKYPTEDAFFKDFPQFKNGGKIKKKYPNGGQVPKRIGSRKNPDGTESTHLMTYTEADGKFYAYPTLFQNPDSSWIELSDNNNWEAFKEAQKRKELIPFKTEKEAADFAGGGWKKYVDGGIVPSLPENVKDRSDLILPTSITRDYKGSFKEAFRSARKELGENQIFTWNGKKYTTALKKDVPKEIPKADKPPVASKAADVKPKTQNIQPAKFSSYREYIQAGMNALSKEQPLPTSSSIPKVDNKGVNNPLVESRNNILNKPVDRNLTTPNDKEFPIPYTKITNSASHSDADNTNLNLANLTEEQYADIHRRSSSSDTFEFDIPAMIQGARERLFGRYTPEEQGSIIPIENVPEFSDYGYQELYKVRDYRGKETDSLVAFTNTFNNATGGDYYIGNAVINTQNKQIPNSRAVGHFLMDADVLPNQSNPGGYKDARNRFIPSNHPSKFINPTPSNDPNQYVMGVSKTKDASGKHKVIYRRNSEITPEERDHFDFEYSVRSHQYSDIDWDSEGPSTGFASKSKYVPLKSGKASSIPYKDKNAFSRFSGGSGIYTFTDPKTGQQVGVDVSGSVNTLKQIGQELQEKYNIKPEELSFLYHDMGSYSAKPASKNDTLNYDQWSNYNTYNKGRSGAPLVIPKYQLGGFVERTQSIEDMKNKKNKKALWGQLINPTHEESGVYDEEIYRRNQILGDQYQPINQQEVDFQGTPNYVSQSWSQSTPTQYLNKTGTQRINPQSMSGAVPIAGAIQQGAKQVGNIAKGMFNAIPAFTALIPEQERTRRNILINDSQPRPHSQAIMEQGGQIQKIADNPIDGPTMLLKGPSHEKGGIPLNIFGQQIEAEGQETIHFANDGTQIDSAVIGGNLSTKYNGKKTKFKNIFKDIAEKDKKANKQESKGLELIIDKDPTNPFEALAFNSGRMLAEGAQVKYEQNAADRDLYTQLQNQMLMEKANTSNKAKDGKIIFAEDGAKIDRQNLRYRQMAHTAAVKAQIDPRVFNRLITQESNWNPKAASGAGAKGIVQFTKDTAKQYGIENILNSDKPEDVEKVLYAGAQHFKKLLDKYQGDYNAALIAYNAGPGGKNIDKGYEAMKRWASKELDIPIEEVTGADVLDYLREVRIKRPSEKQSAYSNETLNYVSSIMGYAPMSDYTTQPDFDAPIQSIPSYGGDPSEDPFRIAREQYQKNKTPITIPVGTDPYSETGLSGEGIPQPNPVPYQPTGREIESDTLIPITESSEQQVLPISQNPNRSSLADSIGLPWGNIAAAVPAIFDRPDYVGRQYYNPILEDPYSISLQDQRNQINAGFRSIERQLPNNPEALAVLAGQRYQAENQVSAQEFRTNQELLNSTLNRNVQSLNQAQQLNNQYADMQMDRQTRAKAVTDDRRQQALSSLADTFAKQRQLKTNIRMLEGTMPYVYNTQTNQYDLVRPEADPINWMGTPSVPTKKTSSTKDGNTTETVTWDQQRYLQAQQKAQQAQQNLLTRIMGSN